MSLLVIDDLLDNPLSFINESWIFDPPIAYK